jgi:uncharacterized protein (DUF488 family)
LSCPAILSRRAYAGNIPPAILTIGHSTRPLEDFVALLQAHGVATLVDVRTVPRSRTNPQFNRDTLPEALARHQIGYHHEPRLGGLRHARRDSPNNGWKNAGFRGFADYMSTPEFQAGIESLLEIAQHGTPALMCAEAVPWRCHRSLIADALTVRGTPVAHIMTPFKAQPHKFTSFARVENGDISYPGEQFPAE